MQQAVVALVGMALLVMFLQEVHTRHEAHDTAVELAINSITERVSRIEKNQGIESIGSTEQSSTSAIASSPMAADVSIPGIFPGVPNGKAVAMPSVHTTSKALR
jgi:hypothetical protein